MDYLASAGKSPGKRFGHTVAQVSKELVVIFGGAVPDKDGFIITNDIFLYDIINNVWKQVELHKTPTPRAAHGSCPVEEMQMVVFGGALGNGSHADNNLYLLRNIGQGNMRWITVPVIGKI